MSIDALKKQWPSSLCLLFLLTLSPVSQDFVYDSYSETKLCPLIVVDKKQRSA